MLGDEVITGGLCVEDGIIQSVCDNGLQAGLDLEGDYLLPGLVELHTDHLENHYRPRPNVFWNPMAALHAHDAQISSSGITTVYDAVRVGSDTEVQNMGHHVDVLIDTISKAKEDKRLRADHFVHLRCELSSHDTLEQFESHCTKDLVRLASVMDHTPGQRQFVKVEQYNAYYQGKTGMSDAEMALFSAARRADQEKYSANNRTSIVETGTRLGLALASHDDATAAHVEEAKENGVAICEFPTTMEAAKSIRAHGMSIMMGAPNVVRGKSHSGNISATELADNSLLDILSSDYVPFSLLQAAFLLPEKVDHISLAQSVAMVTRNPALAAGMTDRGEISPGKKADLVRVHLPSDGVPIVRAVWRNGARVI